MSRNKKGQQEMIGFVLIVVLVVVGLMIFLTISVRNSDTNEVESLTTTNLLNSLMGHTTDCAIVFEPKYDTFEDLFKSCYQNKRCSNLENKLSCEYLNESLTLVLGDALKTDATIAGYELTFFEKDGAGILVNAFGQCQNVRSISSSQRNLISGSKSLIVRLKICNNL